MDTITATAATAQTSDALSPLKAHDDERRSNAFNSADHTANRCGILEQPSDQSNNLLRRNLQNECIDVMTNGVAHKLAAGHEQQQQCACDHLNEINYQQQQTRCTINGDAVIAAVANGATQNKRIYGWNDVRQSNGFHHEENSKENILSINQHDMDARDTCHHRSDDKAANKSANNFLACLGDTDDNGYFDALITSDLTDAEIKLADKKCSGDTVNATSAQNSQSRERIQRRARARSESDQCEFYQLRKQQMRENQDASHLFKNVTDEHQSFRGVPTEYTHEAVVSTRGKSLSPPKIGANRKQVITANALLSRSFLVQRHLARPLNILRRQKLISKAKQQARLSPSSPSKMAKSIVPETTPKISKVVSANDKEAKAHSSDESEYSSLEDDDDDVHDPHDSDEDDLYSDSEDKTDNKATYNSYTGSYSPNNNEHSILADCVEGKYPTKAPLAPSLFPNVPPFITFGTHDEKGPAMPIAIKKILKWKLTTITPIVIRKVLLNSGFRLLKQTNDWMGTWGKHMKSPCFRTMRSYQKINHIPGTFQIGRKDKIWRNLQLQMQRNGRNQFNFMPLTYILPQDLKRLKRLWPQFHQRNTKWIIKPPASARGTGIKVVSKWTQIPKRKPIIVQKYVDRPLLINGSKFDLRLYVLVSSMNPLRAYMYNDGLTRFASVKYSDDNDTLCDRYMHLTNYSINKLSSNYAKNEDANSFEGHKWTLKTLWKYFTAQGINTNGLWAALRNLVLRTILTGEHVINQMSKANVNSRYNTFELFGIDVILDSELKPWLLEVNISPSLHSSSPLDLHVKGPLVTALLNTVLFNVPPRFNPHQQAELMTELGMEGRNLCCDRRLHVTNLSKVERLKHNRFTNKSITNREQYLDDILENLTPDDIRCLIIAEDELARCAPLERICPTPNSYRYMKFTENPRYYNRLLDAWENRYANNRQEGIDLLQEYCRSKVHLIVPIQCTKTESDGKPAEGTDAAPNLSHVCSDNEIDEVFEPSMKAVAQKRTLFDLDTIKKTAAVERTTSVVTKTPTKITTTTATAAKIIDNCDSPLPVPDDQLNEPVIDQHDILVSSIA